MVDPPPSRTVAVETEDDLSIVEPPSPLRLTNATPSENRLEGEGPDLSQVRRQLFPDNSSEQCSSRIRDSPGFTASWNAFWSSSNDVSTTTTTVPNSSSSDSATSSIAPTAAVTESTVGTPVGARSPVDPPMIETAVPYGDGDSSTPLRRNANHTDDSLLKLKSDPPEQRWVGDEEEPWRLCLAEEEQKQSQSLPKQLQQLDRSSRNSETAASLHPSRQNNLQQQQQSDSLFRKRSIVNDRQQACTENDNDEDSETVPPPPRWGLRRAVAWRRPPVVPGAVAIGGLHRDGSSSELLDDNTTDSNASEHGGLADHFADRRNRLLDPPPMNVLHAEIVDESLHHEQLQELLEINRALTEQLQALGGVVVVPPSLGNLSRSSTISTVLPITDAHNVTLLLGNEQLIQEEECDEGGQAMGFEGPPRIDRTALHASRGTVSESRQCSDIESVADDEVYDSKRISHTYFRNRRLWRRPRILYILLGITLAISAVVLGISLFRNDDGHLTNQLVLPTSTPVLWPTLEPTIVGSQYLKSSSYPNNEGYQTSSPTPGVTIPRVATESPSFIASNPSVVPPSFEPTVEFTSESTELNSTSNTTTLPSIWSASSRTPTLSPSTAFDFGSTLVPSPTSLPDQATLPPASRAPTNSESNVRPSSTPSPTQEQGQSPPVTPGGESGNNQAPAPTSPPSPTAPAPTSPTTPTAPAPTSPTTPTAPAPTSPTTPTAPAPTSPTTPTAPAPTSPTTPTSGSGRTQAPVTSPTLVTTDRNPRTVPPQPTEAPVTSPVIVPVPTQRPVTPPVQPPVQTPIATSSPVNRPTSIPATTPTLAPTGGVTATTRSIATRDELLYAVDAYLQNPSPDTEVARTFGYPIGKWNVTQVTDFSRVFSAVRNIQAQAFNEDLSEWDTRNAVDFTSMFAGAIEFNQNLSAWNTERVTQMVGMFSLGRKFNGDISAWKTNRVQNMDRMFRGASSFAGDLSSWNVSSVQSMNGMFAGANQFNRFIGTWNTRNVRSMNGMFAGARRFNRDVSNWIVNRVADLDGMFTAATGFDHDLCRWNGIVNRSAKVGLMFTLTNCEDTNDPDLLASIPGPFCYQCKSLSVESPPEAQPSPPVPPPTQAPVNPPTKAPVNPPTQQPVRPPTLVPKTAAPAATQPSTPRPSTRRPTLAPTLVLSKEPTKDNTSTFFPVPTQFPRSVIPKTEPTTVKPSIPAPTPSPITPAAFVESTPAPKLTRAPTKQPTPLTKNPTKLPTLKPSHAPTTVPTEPFIVAPNPNFPGTRTVSLANEQHDMDFRSWLAKALGP